MPSTTLHLRVVVVGRLWHCYQLICLDSIDDGNLNLWYGNGYVSFYEPNGLIVTDLGEAVRAKNECLFANKLKVMGIPYLYEMNVGGGVVPDFTIFLEDGVRFVELLGMMNDEKYREDQEVKIVKYKQMGIRLGSQLVLIDTTMGISMPEIEKILLDITENGAPQGIVEGYNRKKYDYIETRRRAFCEEEGGGFCEDNGDCFGLTKKCYFDMIAGAVENWKKRFLRWDFLSKFKEYEFLSWKQHKQRKRKK